VEEIKLAKESSEVYLIDDSPDTRTVIVNTEHDKENFERFCKGQCFIVV